MVLVVWDVNLIRQERHRFNDTSSDTFYDKTVYVVFICNPVSTLLVTSNVIITVFYGFVNFFTLVSNVFKSRHNQRLVSLLKIIWERWSHLSLKEWFFPVFHQV